MFFIKALARTRHRCAFPALFAVTSTLLVGCQRETQPPQVVVYTSVDQRFAEQLLARFTEQTGTRVISAFDSEAGKTTGFLHRLRREHQRPRCDVWLSSEVFGTIELARQDVFAPYESPAAADIPVAWKDALHRWTGLAARGRVIAYRTDRIDASKLPQLWRECARSEYAAHTAFANPLFGTTRGHVAAMFAYWGETDARRFLQELRENSATMADGNAHAVRLVAAGAADLCWTDTDDVWSGQARGEPLALTYPKLSSDEPPVWIPCSVALVANGPNPEQGRRLVDFLVSETAERALAESDSRNVPVRPALRAALAPDGPTPQPLDFDRIADALPAANQAVREILLD